MKRIPLWLSAFLLGALLTLAQAPLNVWIAPFVAFPLFLFLLDRGLTTGGTMRRAAWLGWWFGFGNLTTGLYWIGSAMLVEAHKFWWALPLAVAGLPAYLALYPALATALWYALRTRWRLGNPAALFLFALLWSAAEWGRGHMLTGFPWLLLAYGWQGVPAFEQTLALWGAYGLSLATVILAGLPWLFKTRRDRQSRVVCIVVLATFVAALAWGQMRLVGTIGAPDPKALRIRLVQPAIPQGAKLDHDQHAAVVEKLLIMSAAPPDAQTPPPTLIIWPEASVAFYPQLDEVLRARMSQGVPPGAGGAIIFGAPARDSGLDGDTYYNSLFAIDASGRLTARYDKAHLVPFGEFFPLRNWLKKMGINISTIAAGALDFSAGSGHATLSLPGDVPPAAPLICYEVIFPGDVKAGHGNPRWLLNITNDAWFGMTSGPYQHLSIARARAIEEGLPLVRVANTGISAIVNSYGRTQASLGLNIGGVIDGVLPEPASSPTLFSRYGNCLYALFWLACGIVTILLSISRNHPRQTLNNHS